VRRAGLSGISLVLVTQCVSGSVMFFLPGSLVALYTTDPAVFAGAAALLQLAALLRRCSSFRMVSRSPPTARCAG
jgi:MATE family multidrug resistance protein